MENNIADRHLFLNDGSIVQRSDYSLNTLGVEFGGRGFPASQGCYMVISLQEEFQYLAANIAWTKEENRFLRYYYDSRWIGLFSNLSFDTAAT
ncbi:hypothetical protein SOMG_00012 [Schizosaccharomyces osmophilus]|uniref:Uncharacterized protein n=1 Tax=Schizosaccharomyces osmophilus TaxID=2545709 RepID=A0AAF0AVI5_9SCHI|nr:uncharacterized protein SOMG_00012 [Schizosaccharomyces osmophilus]WBW72035.1 hypothetical protein SOMG_00012 [Schizosaccharomyces osmophilus]